MAALRMYDDPHYRQWREMLAQAQDYFYETKMVAWVQGAGHRKIQRLITKISPPFIVDLGCGDGAHLPYVGNRLRYLGIDIDLPSLLKLKARFPEALALRGDVMRLPLADASVPCLVNIYNLEHMPFLDLALEEIARVLAPGGHLLVSVPSVDGLAARLARRMSSAQHFNKLGLDYDRVSDLEHVNCIWQMEKAFRRHFRVAQRSLFPLGFPVLSWNLIVTYVLTPR